MILPLTVVLLLLAVPLVGGRLRSLADVRLRLAPLGVAALAAQVVLLQVVAGDVPVGVAVAVHLASGLAALVVVGANLHRVPGLAVVCLGGALNLLVIAANGGVMPVADHAAGGRTGTEGEDGFANAAVVDDPALPWLGDVIPVPLPGILDSAVSPGDLVMVAGVGVLLWRLCVTPGRRRDGHGAAVPASAAASDVPSSEAPAAP